MSDSSKQILIEASADAGEGMHQLLTELYPIHRSMAGEGLRETLGRLAESIDLSLIEIPTGSAVLDWEVPQEWRIRDAYVKNVDSGERVIDYRESNLHVVSHSQPIRKTMTWAELQPHLYTNKEMPDAIPYQTAFFREQWGFCLSHRQYCDLKQAPEARYETVIDAEFVDGSLTLGELVLAGESKQEFLIHAHTCHPSLANDNLSGIVVALEIAKILAKAKRRFTYRFVFAPATIGAICWLARNQALPPIRFGLVLTLLGDSAPLTYKRSLRFSSEIDRIAEHVVKHRIPTGSVRDFEPWGYDERQYCSPGFNLPVGCLMRSVHHEFPEYHTSADSPDFVDPNSLADSLDAALQMISIAEHNRFYRHLQPHGEPMLGKRGFFSALSTVAEPAQVNKAALWLLSLSNSAHDLLSIAEQAKLPFRHFAVAARLLQQLELLQPCERQC